MTSSGSVYSATLREITTIKLDELTKRRASFDNAKDALLASVKGQEDPVKRVQALSDGVKHCFSVKVDKSGQVLLGHTKHAKLEVELKNLDGFLAQARHDPSVSTMIVADWEETLRRCLAEESTKYKYAALYAQLVTEWLADGPASSAGTGGGDVGMSEGFEDVGSAMKIEQRKLWEENVFKPAQVDEIALKMYLNGIFDVEDSSKPKIHLALHALREQVEQFEISLSSPGQFDEESLAWIIDGLLASDLLSDDKREALRDFKNNRTILLEIADLLNLRMAALDSWSWGSEVLLEERRSISGSYNIVMHEDLLQAMFLQYVGVKWSVFFKHSFSDMRQGAWKPMTKVLPQELREKLSYYLGTLKEVPSLHGEREKYYLDDYFMAKLLAETSQRHEDAQGNEEAEYGEAVPMRMMQQAAPALQPATLSVNGPSGGARVHFRGRRGGEARKRSQRQAEAVTQVKSPMELKKQLLHLLATDITINMAFHDELTAFHSVFDSWNPLLPHQTILIILKFFGVSDTWIGFFLKFLQAPLRFMNEHEARPRERRRGTPAAHVLSDVFGEVVLFCLDFSVNQSTDGSVLWRVGDDLWFWSHNHKAAVKAWEDVTRFVAATGVRTRKEKTGTVRIGKKGPLPIGGSLPQGQIRWGFLYLSPESGRFEIDQTMVDKHIGELRRQLQGKKSIFSFIAVWNSYATTFFSSNFGKPAHCFGREHVDKVLATHRRIQKDVFSDLSPDGNGGSSSVIDYLKRVLKHRFDIDDIPDGYFFFPTELGGLDLQSPFVSLLQTRDSILASPDEPIRTLEDAEKDFYASTLATFYTTGHHQTYYRHPSQQLAWKASEQDAKTMLPFEEMIRVREVAHPTGQRYSATDVFRQLMGVPQVSNLEKNDGLKVVAALNALVGRDDLKHITGYWDGMDAYWQWVAMMYGEQIVDKFGELNIVDKGLLPMGMVSMLRNKRVSWDG